MIITNHVWIKKETHETLGDVVLHMITHGSDIYDNIIPSKMLEFRFDGSHE